MSTKSSKYGGTKLTGVDSFDNWKNDLEDSLVVDGQINLIEAKRVPEKSLDGEIDAAARSATRILHAQVSLKISQSVNENHRSIIGAFKHPQDKYNALILKYEGNNETQYHHLVTRFTDITEGKSMGIHEKVELMRKLQAQVLKIRPKNNIPEWLMVHTLKLSVDAEQYETTLQVINQSTVELEFDDIISRLASRETELTSNIATANWAWRR